MVEEETYTEQQLEEKLNQTYPPNSIRRFNGKVYCCGEDGKLGQVTPSSKSNVGVKEVIREVTSNGSKWDIARYKDGRIQVREFSLDNQGNSIRLHYKTKEPLPIKTLNCGSVEKGHKILDVLSANN